MNGVNLVGVTVLLLQSVHRAFFFFRFLRARLINSLPSLWLRVSYLRVCFASFIPYQVTLKRDLTLTLALPRQQNENSTHKKKLSAASWRLLQPSARFAVPFQSSKSAPWAWERGRLLQSGRASIKLFAMCFPRIISVRSPPGFCCGYSVF